MSLDIASNHFAFGPVLRTRLESVAGIITVGGIVEMDEAMREGVLGPSAFVVYGGTVTRAAPAGKMRRPRAILQTWEVNVMAPMEWMESDQMQASGALMAALSDTLEGWRPAGANKELEPVAVEDPVIYAGGMVHFVLAYQIDLMLI
jgi:hypothetical protein